MNLVEPTGGQVLDTTIQESPIKIYLVLENRLLRESLCRLCRKRADLQLAGHSGKASLTPQEVLQLQLQCDVILFDFFNPRWLPLPCHALMQDANPIRAVLIGMDCDRGQFLEAVKAGICGYLLKNASAVDVIAAIRAAFKGEAVCPPELCSALFQCVQKSARQESGPIVSPGRDLTLRQRQLVGLVAQGLTNKEIARHLNLSEFTVRNHIHRILKLVDVGSRREAVEVVRAQHPLHASVRI